MDQSIDFQAAKRLRFGDNIDIILKASSDGVTIPTNRALLSSCSEYFRAMFSNQFKESEQNEIVLSAVNGVILGQLIDYCESGTLSLNQDNVQDVIQAAHQFNFSKIVDACSEYMIDHLDVTNCFGLFVYAELLDLKELKRFTIIYICQHFIELSKSDEFKEISIETLRQILKIGELDVPSEGDVFHAVVTWVNHDSVNRKTYFVELITFVRLQLLDEQFLKDHVEKITEEMGCKYLIDNILNWNTKREFDKSLRLGTYNYVDRIMTLSSKRDRQNELCLFCPQTQQWKTWKTLDAFEDTEGLVIFDKFAFLTSMGYSKTLRKFNVLSAKVVATYELKTSRNDAILIVVNNYLYVIGGYVEGLRGYQHSIEKYDLTDFKFVEEIPIRNFHVEIFQIPKAIYIDNSIYLISTQNIARLCLNSNEWRSLRMPIDVFRSSIGSIVAFNGYLYLLVERSATEFNVMQYDPAVNQMTRINSIIVDRYPDQHTLHVYDNELYAIFVQLDKQNYRLHKYCPENNVWNEIAVCMIRSNRFQVFNYRFADDLV